MISYQISLGAIITVTVVIGAYLFLLWRIMGGVSRIERGINRVITLLAEGAT
jgi:hypothetical protein